MLLTPKRRDSQHPLNPRLNNLPDLLCQLSHGLIRNESQALTDNLHQWHFTPIRSRCISIHVQQVHLVGLKQKSSFFIIKHFGISSKSRCAKGDKVVLIVEKNRCMCFLIVCIIAWVEHFNSGLSGRIGMLWSYSIA
jgi:hypothetical protein